MRRWLQMSLLLGIIAILIAPATSNAYSYGDPNAEDVAETFKLVIASLAESEPDWTAAAEAFKVRRAEISSHFGEAVSVTLDNNIKAKDSGLFVSNFKAVLVMNLERRFENAVSDVKDYTKAKLLLAKAKATFETLEPYMNANVSENKQAFEDALNALGNPGLFGVGKKEVKPEVFKQKLDSIYSSVKPMFVYKAYIKPTATPKPVVKETTAPSKTSEPTATPSATVQASAEPSVSPTASPDSAVASASPSPVPTEQVVQSSAEPSVEPSEAPIVETAAPSPDNAIADAGEVAHDPMEQTDKTNSVVTFLLIGAVLVIGGGAVWFAKKKGLF